MVKYYRKRYRRKRSTLSNYKIATKTSAKAQSRQIYALKKRVNTIYRMNKPEIRIQQRNSPVITLNSNVASAVSFATTGSNTSQSIVPLLGTEVSSLTGNAPINNFVRLRGFNLYGHLEYSTMAETVQPVTVRVVIVQSRTTRGSQLAQQDIFSSSANSSLTLFNNVFGPLQTGVSRTCKILSDKRYVLSYQRPAINMRTNLKYLFSYYRDTASNLTDSSSEEFAKGSIYVFYAVYGQDLTNSNATMNFIYKLAYVDN